MIDMLEDYTISAIIYMKHEFVDKDNLSYYDKDGVYYPSSNTIDFAISQSMA